MIVTSYYGLLSFDRCKGVKGSMLAFMFMQTCVVNTCSRQHFHLHMELWNFLPLYLAAVVEEGHIK